VACETPTTGLVSPRLASPHLALPWLALPRCASLCLAVPRLDGLVAFCGQLGTGRRHSTLRTDVHATDHTPHFVTLRLPLYRVGGVAR